MTNKNDFQRLGNAHFIDGAAFKGANPDQFQVISPVSEEVQCGLSEATEDEIQRCIEVANARQKVWAAESSLDRTKVLHEIASAMDTAVPMLGELMTREMGKPLNEACDEVGWTTTAFRYFAEIARHEYGRVHGPIAVNHLNYSYREPLGVAVLVMPYNYPVVLVAWSAAAALATGNTVIIKPSEYTSITTLRMAEVIESVAPGLVQVLTGSVPTVTGLVKSTDTHIVSFTGSVAGARAVNEMCASLFKRCLLEASGSDPFIVMPSADMDIAVRAATFTSFMNCGQICTSAERMYIHEHIYDEFIERLGSQAAALRIGDGLERTTDLGPMANQREVDRVAKAVALAVSEGAELVHGGERPAEFAKGWFYRPTVLANTTHQMSIMNNEIFGPAVAVTRVGSLDEAIDLANDCPLALGSNVYSQNLAEVHESIRRIESGMVWVNAPLFDNDAGPFGGNKATGGGRVLGLDGLNAFTRNKLAWIDSDPKSGPDPDWWFPYNPQG
ncbi:MAG: aldehyde dehydrogenase family protein [Pseudomonadota bacterium]